MTSTNNSFEENPENLRKLFYLHQIVTFSIKDIVCSAGSSSGDNYMSVVKRVQVIGQNYDGDNDDATAASNKEPQKLSVIIKRQIPSKSRRTLYRCDEAMVNEINAYTHMVPLLEQYITTEDNSRDAIFPKLHFAGKDDQGEIMVMEDLRELGFRMQNRLAGLDLRTCESIMKQLGKLHAASIAAKRLNGEIFHEKRAQIRDIVYSPEAEEFYKSMLESSVQEALISLRASNVEGCLTEPIRLIEKLQSQLYSQVQRSITNSQENLNVMCHGDLWINNIMFVEGEAEEDKVAIKFFDLQAMRYTSPVFDILHLIYTSTKRDLRDGYTKILLQTYCAALSTHLEQQFAEDTSHLSELRDTFSLANISAEYYKNVLYGMAVAMWILPAVTFDPTNIPNLDAISEANPSAKEIKCTQKLTPEYHSRLKDIALEFYQSGYLYVAVASTED